MRVCELTGKRRNVANNVSHAHNKSKKVQNPNLQYKRIWIADEARFVRLRLSTRAIRSINKLGFAVYCAKNGIDAKRVVAAH